MTRGVNKHKTLSIAPGNRKLSINIIHYHQYYGSLKDDVHTFAQVTDYLEGSAFYLDRIYRT